MHLLRILRASVLLLFSPFLITIAAAALALTDVLWFIAHRRKTPRPSGSIPFPPQTATVVIPNWNGRDLLAKYLPSVVAAVQYDPGNEIIVVDNGSSDGSAEFVRANFPQVKVLALERNLGFGGGSNAGIRAAKNGIAVLLNSDMRVDPDFLKPLLEGFTDDSVFSVSCQIFFSDPKKIREETGLTQGWWENGGLKVRHRLDPGITDLYPCLYGGGGSCAYDRTKFLELGGFDPLLAPFYLEDTDIGYMAWKRGWKVLYQPRSVVYHEHRGTIGKNFTSAYIRSVLDKNFVLFAWKNIHEWKRLLSHFFFTLGEGVLSLFAGASPERASLSGLWRAFCQLPAALCSRWAARSLAEIDDTEAFRRPLGGYFRDRFAVEPDGALRVLFVSPYPICPPVHGGGVFMLHTLRELACRCEVHVIALLDEPRERPPHEELGRICASMELLVRLNGKRGLASIAPHSVCEFSSGDLEWLIHRQIYVKRINVVQLEYTSMAQYRGDFRNIVCALFEHDIYFQSIGRALREPRSPLWKANAALEYLRALRYELRTVPKFDRVQVCSRENREWLVSFIPEMESKVQDGLRAGIDTSSYRFRTDGREPFTMLFIGSFRHLPNQTALNWFLRCVLPEVLKKRPEARLVVVGADAPPAHVLAGPAGAIELFGSVEDVREPLSRYSVFVCPVLSGSGVRVKLLEAFASGIPVVSTKIGAEGLARQDGEICRLASEPDAFAAAVLALFDDPEGAAEMAVRARAEVTANWDSAVITARLVESYADTLCRKRNYATSS